MAAIEELRIAAAADVWLDCGFAVSDGRCSVGSVRLRFEAGEGGIAGWALSGADSAELDGLETALVEPGAGASAAGEQPNGVLRIDHLVIFSPELKRTLTAIEGAGIDLRRIREPDEPGPPVRQAFFRLGEVILEVVENPRAPEGPASFWGITFCVADLDRCAELLGERLGEIRDAVQPGRRIATVRRDAGLGVAVALITA